MARIEPDEVGLDNLRPKPGSRKQTKRLGRGHGSGQGKTSGRGHKGYGSARAASARPATRAARTRSTCGCGSCAARTRRCRCRSSRSGRTPSRSTSATLEERFEAGAEVTPESLQAAGLATRKHPVKVLGKGEISKKLTVRAHAFSASAREKIEAAGGTAELLD